MIIHPDFLADEESIVWIKPIDSLDYVRQNQVDMSSRRRHPSAKHCPGGKENTIVGYAIMKPSALSYCGYFRRRVFWLKPHDRAFIPDGTYRTGAPAEAVDPRTVSAGVLGTLTNRAWGIEDVSIAGRVVDDWPDGHVRFVATLSRQLRLTRALTIRTEEIPPYQAEVLEELSLRRVIRTQPCIDTRGEYLLIQPARREM